MRKTKGFGSLDIQSGDFFKKDDPYSRVKTKIKNDKEYEDVKRFF